jgi:CRISPR-associated protein Csb2
MKRASTAFLQVAIGSRVAPTLDHVALLSNWFRGRAIRIFLERAFGLPKGDWKVADEAQREAVSLLSGKLPHGHPMTGHHHTHYGLYLDPESGRPSRLMAWRETPFTEMEHAALMEAAVEPFSLGFTQPRRSQDSPGDPWLVHCVPLDSAVPPPSGFDSAQKHRVWRSMTPYVPPRHAFDSRGKPKKGESPMEQLAREAEHRGFHVASVRPLNAQNGVASEGSPSESTWVKVHGQTKQSNASNLSKRGYRFQLTFPEPVSGPIALGHSSHFGLGLFVPADAP